MELYSRLRRAKTTVPTNREGELIHRLAKAIPSIGLRGDRGALRAGIGDDAAIFRGPGDREWAVSCDVSLEGVHFHAQGQPPESVGYKCLARATSDLAAMGAQPRYFLLSLALPQEKTRHWLERFAAGMAQASHRFGIRLIGGDTSKSSSVMISITVLGELALGRAILRCGASLGNLIYVSGKLGAAQLGLEIVRHGLAKKPSLAKLIRPHFYPGIRIELGQWLAERGIPSAMIDLSDGLSTDLARLCAASGVGARIYANEIPKITIPDFLAKPGLDALELSLHGGEDYELLFTAPPKFASLLRRAPEPPVVTRIGEITQKREVVLIGSDGAASNLPALGWDHFRRI
jgi:thiamine-monophosphate kinase